jgi:hypothetical protein
MAKTATHYVNVPAIDCESYDISETQKRKTLTLSPGTKNDSVRKSTILGNHTAESSIIENEFN